ncbi:diguanylate cyclase domain-containing protein, partial [Kibdelosporangium persicum]
GGGGAPGTSDLAASALGGTSNQDILGRELAGWEMVARERAMDLAGQTRAGSDLVAADRAAPEWAGADPAAVDRVVGRAAVDSAAVDLAAVDGAAVDLAAVESEPDRSATAERPSRPKGKRAADADKPKWPDPSQNERDEETGLLNRQGLRRRLAAARRQSRPTALTLVRLEPSGEADPEPEERKKDPDSTDRFSAALIKAIDTAGRVPPEIDPDVLTSLADHVRDMAPQDAELARPDDGELAVLLPDTTRDEAEQFAATLRETVSASDWDPQDPARGVSVSTGVAQYQEGTSEDALLSAAREALTSTEHDTDRPDWQAVEPVYDLPPEDSGYTYIQEYADLSSDGPDPEMAKYLAAFPLPDYGRQWPAVEQPESPGHDTADTDESGRSILDRLDITRGSGGRRRAPDAFNADQSTDFDQYAIKQPMESYSNTGDEILAAAEEAERASIPRTPEPEEIPAPPDGPEVPIPPDPDADPQPGRRRRPADPADPDADPLTKPRPRFPTGPDIPAPPDPDADPEPRRRRWTSESDAENPRARRRALPRDPSRRAVEPGDDPEATGPHRMPGPLEEPAFSSQMDPPKRPSDVGQSTGRRRMPDPPAEPETAAGRRRAPEPVDEAPSTASGRRHMPEPDEPEPTGRSAPGESTGRRRMPDALSDPEPTGRRRMPDALSDPESTGRRRMPEVVDDPESTGRRRVADALSDPEPMGRRKVPGSTDDPESTGRRRMPDALSDPESTGRRRMPENADDPESTGRRRVADLLKGLESTGRRRMPGLADEATGRRRLPEPADDPESTGRRRMPDAVAEAERPKPESLADNASSQAFPGAVESTGRRHKPEDQRVSRTEPAERTDPLPGNDPAKPRLGLDDILAGRQQTGGVPAETGQPVARRLPEPLGVEEIQAGRRRVPEPGAAEPPTSQTVSESPGLDDEPGGLPEQSSPGVRRTSDFELPGEDVSSSRRIPGQETVRHPMSGPQSPLPAPGPGQATVRRGVPETPEGTRKAPEQSGPADLDDFPSAGRRLPGPAPAPEVFSLGPDGLSRRRATPGTPSPEPVEETIQPAALDELAKRRQAERAERQERLRRRVEQSGEATGDDRPSRLRRRERTDLKLADLLAEALVAYQSSTSEAPGEDVLSAYEDLDGAPGEDPGRHQGGTGY